MWINFLHSRPEALHGASCTKTHFIYCFGSSRQANIQLNPTLLQPCVCFLNEIVNQERSESCYITTPTTIGITIIFMFHNFFRTQARSWYLSTFSLSFIFSLLEWQNSQAVKFFSSGSDFLAGFVSQSTGKYLLFLDNRSLWKFIILLIWEFFTPALADIFSLEFEWQQVASSLQDFS